MGGHRAGEIASRVVMDQFVNCFDSIPPFDNVDELKKWVNETIYEADAIVKRMAKQNVEHHGMGTTIVVAILMDNVIYISHVGDSRAYVLKNDQLMQLTKDHTLVNALGYASGVLKAQQRRILRIEIHDDVFVICCVSTAR